MNSKYGNGVVIIGGSENPMVKSESDLTLRSHVEDIMEMLNIATKELYEAGQRIYTPKPENPCEGINIPQDDSLESFILRTKEIARAVRDKATEVNSRI